MKKSSIAISIVNYKSYKQIKRLLYSISNSKKINISIIYIVENSKSPSEAIKLEKLLNRFSFQARVKKSQNNCGYCGGHNHAYKTIKKLNIAYDKFLIINPDITFDVNCLKKMTTYMKGNVGGVMCSTKDINTRKILYTNLKFKGMFTEYINSNNSSSNNTNYLAGSFFMVSKKLLLRIGMPFEDYFMYWEDVDLSLKIRKLKYRLCSLNKVKVYREGNLKERNINALKYSIENSYKIVHNHPEYFSKKSHMYYLIMMYFRLYFNYLLNFIFK